MTRKPWVVLCATVLLAGISAEAEAAYTPPQRTISLRITSVDPSHESSCDDFHQYFKLNIGGESSGEIDVPFSFDGKGGPPLCFAYASGTETFEHEIEKVITRDACRDDSTVPISIRMFERDGAFNADDVEAHISLDVDVSTESTVTGCTDQEDRGGFCWELSVNDPELTDSDGDGLMDLWETQGVDINCDGEMKPGQDLYLHQMGVSPTHKDILLELNWFSGFAPTAAALGELKQVFANAPITAGGIANPDGEIGINVIIDAGALVNDVGAHSIGGRDFGPPSDSPNSAPEFHTFVESYEDVKRIGFFRQFLMAPILMNGGAEPGVAGLSVGNDRIQVDGSNMATLVHELGHALGLAHGGELNGERARGSGGKNCKPNHISVMNYAYGASGGIRFETGGSNNNFFVDFSPSKIPDNRIIVTALANAMCPVGSFGCNRRLPLLPAIDEQRLDEVTPLILEDSNAGILVRHHINYGTPNGILASQPLVDPVDWDADPNTHWDADPNTLQMAYSGNPDVITALAGTQGCTLPENLAQSVLENLDEWSRMILPPGRGVIGASLILDPNEYQVDDHEPFSEELIERTRRQMLETDLSVLAALSPVPSVIGEPGTLQIDVSNLGSNSASDGAVRIVLPEGVFAPVLPSECTRTSESSIECSTANFDGYEVRSLEGYSNVGFFIDLEFAPNLTGNRRYVYVGVDHEGNDPDSSNNSVAIEVTTQPAFLGFDDTQRPWIRSNTNPTSVVPTTDASSTGGSRALSLGCGYLQFESPTFDTAELELAADELVFDVYVPSGQDPYWVGDIQLTVDIPSAGIFGRWIGSQTFTFLQRNAWSRGRIAIPQAVKSALLGDYPDARFKFASNVATCGVPILFDSLRFERSVVFRANFHPGDHAPIVSSSVLTFEDSTQWSIASGSTGSTAQESSNVNQGLGALAVDPSGWTRIESRPFSTAELSSVTSRLGFELFIPDLPPDFYWLGYMSAFVECPSAGLWNTFIGHQPLQILFDGEFNRIEFDLPVEVVDTLEGDFADCRFALDFSTNSTLGELVIDGGGFVQ